MVRPRAWRSGRARRALGGRARFLSLQFQTELRKILLSLIEVAQKLLALSPGAVELFTKANGTRPARAGGREPRPDPGSPPAASSRSTETGSTQSTWSAFRARSVSCHRPRLCGRGLAAVSGSLRSGSPPACGARARRCAQGPWRTPLPPGPCPGLTGAVSRPQRCWTRTRTSGWTRRPCGSLRRWAFPRAGPRRPSG